MKSIASTVLVMLGKGAIVIETLKYSVAQDGGSTEIHTCLAYMLLRCKALGLSCS